jgi:signal transduction histidine kinase
MSNGPPAVYQDGAGAATTTRINGRRLGHGLSGMRERVTLLDGTFSAGPTPEGGFEVAAELPITAPA